MLLPILLTILIVGFLINLLTKPFLGSVETILSHFEIFKHSYFIFESDVVITIVSKLLILIGLTLFILLIGVIGKLFLIDYMLRFGNFIFHNIPYINKIYIACQDVVHGLFSNESKSFSQVVFVPFPTPETLSVGLVTKDAIAVHLEGESSDFIPVFVPGTPNPTVGFMLMLKREQLIFADMKIDEAMKFVVSCGVVMPNFTIQREGYDGKEA